jgi:hypothetical protein
MTTEHVDVHGIMIKVDDETMAAAAEIRERALDQVLTFAAFARWPGSPRPSVAADGEEPEGERAYIFGHGARRQALKALAVRRLQCQRTAKQFEADFLVPPS